MSDTREKQDIRQENQECLKRAEDEIEHRRQRAESFGLAPGDKAGSIGRLRSFCALLPQRERTRLKGTAVENCDKDLFAIASMGNTKNRGAVISALPDPDNPASSLQEALHRYASAEQTHGQACSLLRAWRRANPDALKKFASWMSARRPGFGPSIFTAVDVYLGEGGRES